MTAPSSQFPRLRDEKQPHSSRVQDNVNATLAPMATAINQTPMMGVAPVLVAFELNAAFTNFNTIAGFGLFAGASYYKDAFMRLWSIGVLVCAAGCGAGAAVGTFPAGFRPGSTQRKAVEGNGASTQFISITPTGVCSVEVAIGAGGTVDFDFSFLAER